MRTYTGWYPQLFFLNTRALSSVISPYDTWDALVTDMHTDPPEPLVNDAGCILHKAVGNIALLMVAVNWGAGDCAVYAGPVMTHYEFERGPTTRETDSEWKTELRDCNYAPQPSWTEGYLVPGAVTIPYDIW